MGRRNRALASALPLHTPPPMWPASLRRSHLDGHEPAAQCTPAEGCARCCCCCSSQVRAAAAMAGAAATAAAEWHAAQAAAAAACAACTAAAASPVLAGLSRQLLVGLLLLALRSLLYTRQNGGGGRGMVSDVGDSLREIEEVQRWHAHKLQLEQPATPVLPKHRQLA